MGWLLLSCSSSGTSSVRGRPEVLSLAVEHRNDEIGFVHEVPVPLSLITRSTVIT
jgi:hypothetical protein